jgi:hypothetical protein
MLVITSSRASSEALLAFALVMMTVRQMVCARGVPGVMRFWPM